MVPRPEEAEGLLLQAYVAGVLQVLVLVSVVLGCRAYFVICLLGSSINASACWDGQHRPGPASPLKVHFASWRR